MGNAVNQFMDANQIETVTPTNPLPVYLAGSPPGSIVPKGYQQIVGLVAATALTVPAGSKYCIVQTDGQAVRWRDDGTAPTAAIGQPLAPGQTLWYDASLAAIQFIQQAATATLNVTYYG